MSRAKRHTHKYYKANVAEQTVWACALPMCNHYMPAHMANLVNGKFSVCWKCGETFTLNPSNMKMDKPECDDCRGLAVATEELPLSDVMKQFIEKKVG